MQAAVEKRTPTAAEVLEAHGGNGPGFDFLRLFLSSAVVFLHSFFVCYGKLSEISGAVGSYGAPLFMALLPMFFGLSGFLVAGSAVRTAKVSTFLLFRALRLVPALAVEVSLAALILGPLVTTVSLSEYFSSKTFFAYFGNIVGRVRYELPGVFLTNPEPNVVNMNLWTLHAELECYAIMAATLLFGLVSDRRVLLCVWVIGTLAIAAVNLTTGLFEPGSLYPTSIFVYTFCTGVVAYLWRDRIPIDRRLFFGSAAAYCVLIFVPHTVVVVVALLTYILIYIGLSDAFRLRGISGDYSYGIYIYSFVVQQTLVLLLPIREWWILFPVSLAISLAFAAASWHIIEKPALRLKRLFVTKKSAAST